LFDVSVKVEQLYNVNVYGRDKKKYENWDGRKEMLDKLGYLDTDGYCYMDTLISLFFLECWRLGLS